ncbi:MAG: protein kinase domain-containing protein [Oscillochloridaceae bacterium umkhey_bin13]
MAQFASVVRAVPVTPTQKPMAEVAQILCPRCHKPNLRRARFCQECGHDIILNNDAPSDARRYVITRVIKQGGQGAVFEGLDGDGRVYAIKEMLDRFTDPRERSEAIQRFNDEAEILQRLNHPQIPRVYSHFRDEGRHYLTMDFVRGEDLEQIVEHEGRLDEQRVLAWARQICDVLAYLHGKGLIYRDMKPSNVMIERDGTVKIIDFGITKLFKPTERGTQIGTPGYAPPEQYQGMATPQSDVYALGATLHHLLTGRDPTEQLPFSFPAARDLVPTLSQRTSAALERALQKAPQDRFATVHDFWMALSPTPQRAPAQVRVAPSTGRVPQASAQIGTPPTFAAAPVRPDQATRPAPPRVRSQRPGLLARFTAFVSAVVRTIITLLMLAVLALGVYVYLERPTWAEPYLAPLLEFVPTSSSSSQPVVPTEAVTYQLQVSVPSGASGDQIRLAFINAFAATAQQIYGPNVRVKLEVLPDYTADSPELLSDDGTTAIYAAQIQGYLEGQP